MGVWMGWSVWIGVGDMDGTWGIWYSFGNEGEQGLSLEIEAGALPFTDKFYEKGVLKNFTNINRKRSVSESLF